MDITAQCFSVHIGLKAETLEQMLAEESVQPETLSNLQSHLDKIKRVAELEAAEALRKVLS